MSFIVFFCLAWKTSSFPSTVSNTRSIFCGRISSYSLVIILESIVIFMSAKSSLDPLAIEASNWTSLFSCAFFSALEGLIFVIFSSILRAYAAYFEISSVNFWFSASIVYYSIYNWSAIDFLYFDSSSFPFYYWVLILFSVSFL